MKDGNYTVPIRVVVAKGDKPLATWYLIRRGMTAAHLGYLIEWLDPADPRPAREQINSGYLYGGWQPFEGHVLADDNTLRFSGDPPMRPLAEARLREELIVLYPHDWVAIIQPDRSFEVARID